MNMPPLFHPTRLVGRLWLVVRLFVCLFRIAHFIFISTLYFCFGFIQPSASSLFTCECEHKLNVSSTHLVCCSFGG
jgi:hypothetical protein